MKRLKRFKQFYLDNQKNIWTTLLFWVLWYWLVLYNENILLSKFALGFFLGFGLSCCFRIYGLKEVVSGLRSIIIQQELYIKTIRMPENT